VHDVLDVALLRVRLPEPRPVIGLAADAARAGDEVARVGYPFEDPYSPLFADAIFDGHDGVKRAAIGEVLESSQERLFHDCSTLGGNSGSPLFSLSSGRVTGLHCGGPFMYRNEAIPAVHLTSFLERVRAK